MLVGMRLPWVGIRVVLTRCRMVGIVRLVRLVMLAIGRGGVLGRIGWWNRVAGGALVVILRTAAWIAGRSIVAAIIRSFRMRARRRMLRMLGREPRHGWSTFVWRCCSCA